MPKIVSLAMALAVAILFACPAHAETWVPVPAGTSKITAAGVTYGVQNAGRAWSLLRDTDSNSYRMECRSGDEWAKDAGRTPARDRSELSSQAKLPEGVPYTVRFTMETGGVPRASDQTVLTQQHATDDDGSTIRSWPIWSFDFSQKYGFRIITSSAKADGKPIGRTVYQSWKWSNGVPHKVAVRFVNDRGEGKGAFAAWIDGVKVVDQTGIPLGYPTKVAPYLKYGCYRFRAADKVTVTYRNLVGPTANDPGPF